MNTGSPARGASQAIDQNAPAMIILAAISAAEPRLDTAPAMRALPVTAASPVSASWRRPC
jgi:hypothetical protein